MSKSIYEARPIKRRRSNAQLAQLDEQIIAVLEQDHPQSVRHTFYMMTNPRLREPVEKSEHGYEVREGKGSGQLSGTYSKRRELLRGRIEALLPENALAVAKVAEESERLGLEALAEVYRRGAA